MVKKRANADLVSTRPLLDKLGVKPGSKVALVNLDDPTFMKQLRERTSDIVVGKPRSKCDLIFMGASTPADLRRLIANAMEQAHDNVPRALEIFDRAALSKAQLREIKRSYFASNLPAARDQVLGGTPLLSCLSCGGYARRRPDGRSPPQPPRQR